MSSSYAAGDEIEFRVEKIVPRGLGLGFGEKLTVFVPLAAPGDLLRVRITNIRKRTAFAEIVEVIEAGPHRIQPPCPYFGVCGGCDFQQLDYKAQLAAKTGIIRDCLHRIGKIDLDDDIPMIGSPKDFSYRSRARWHLDRDTKTLGYYRRDSHEVVDIQVCPIATPELQATLEKVRETVDWNRVWTERAELEGAVGDHEQSSLFSRDMPEATADLTFAAGGEIYSYSAETFFQANQFLIDDLIETAIGNTGGGMAFDLYSGVGLFTLPLARRFERVLAVEGSQASVAYAKRNVENAGLANVKVIAKGVEKFLLENRTGDVDLVLIDPPRSGTEKRTIPAIVELKPNAISYVACEPAMLARDLRVLLDGGYQMDSIT
ncbi:MAG: class I SAM-dependent RNA methyltransferase, partial [Pyrinomonadaceae bacterium]